MMLCKWTKIKQERKVVACANILHESLEDKKKSLTREQKRNKERLKIKSERG